MPRTAKELSPEELQQYRLRFNQHFQNRDPVDEALLHRAWKTARQVAVMLYENFEATQNGEEWHKNLLKQMTESNAIRPAVLSQETGSELQSFLGFRHVFIYIYADELDYEQTLGNADRVKTIFPRLSTELDIFITWLEQQVPDE